MRSWALATLEAGKSELARREAKAEETCHAPQDKPARDSSAAADKPSAFASDVEANFRSSKCPSSSTYNLQDMLKRIDSKHRGRPLGQASSHLIDSGDSSKVQSIVEAGVLVGAKAVLGAPPPDPSLAPAPKTPAFSSHETFGRMIHDEARDTARSVRGEDLVRSRITDSPLSTRRRGGPVVPTGMARHSPIYREPDTTYPDWMADGPPPLPIAPSTPIVGFSSEGPPDSHLVTGQARVVVARKATFAAWSRLRGASNQIAEILRPEDVLPLREAEVILIRAQREWVSSLKNLQVGLADVDDPRSALPRVDPAETAELPQAPFQEGRRRWNAQGRRFGQYQLPGQHNGGFTSGKCFRITSNGKVGDPTRWKCRKHDQA